MSTSPSLSLSYPSQTIDGILVSASCPEVSATSDTGLVDRPSPPGSGHVASLDGLRALAVGAVMLFHAHVPFFGLGMVGVDLFFVLSGFLITSLLLEERSKTGRIDLLRFWMRRFLRLAPAYWLYIAGLTMAIVAGVGWTHEQYGWTSTNLIKSLWLYYYNYTPWAIWEHQVVAAHLWSLAVEEQFYLVWPLLVTVSFGLGMNRRTVAVATWAIALAMAVRNVFAPTYMELQLDMRGFSIVLGCAFALSVAAWPGLRSMLQRRRVGEVAAAGTLLLLIVATLADMRKLLSPQALWGGVVPLFAIGVAIVVANLWIQRDCPLGSFLRWRPLVHLGRISYGLYLYHFLVLHLSGLMLSPLATSHPMIYRPIRLGIYLACTYVIAALSYRFVEARFLRLKSHLRPHRAERPAPVAA